MTTGEDLYGNTISHHGISDIVMTDEFDGKNLHLFKMMRDTLREIYCKWKILFFPSYFSPMF